ncbi:MAG: protein kinase [Pyrinomonadaceae bacterium]
MPLTPDDYKRLKSVFNEAVELHPSEREAFLSSSADTAMRPELEKMLEAVDAEEDPLETPAIEQLDISSVPETIGSFRIVREIGRGGMGSVYEGTRIAENFTQRAAVKVIRNGMNNDIILRRFLSEQKILASLEHSTIARFLDGGTTTLGLPFYAMEFVDGTPIAEYSRDKQLSHRDIVGLFRQVCSAVSYAHSQLVVHRDLKPSNILVDRTGTPKLLDFGIAKVLEADSLESETATQLGMMTPQYASPEQIRGETVTTASDVYSLGMILHELLYGEPPYRTDTKTYAEIVDLVSADRPTRRTTTQPRRSDDLFRIVSKALRRDLDQRYASVESLSDDLRRWLEGLPISARAETLGYRAKKFVQRNRIAAIASLLVFVSLVSGIIVAAWQARRAVEQRILAERRFTEVRSLANNVVFKYHDEIAKLEGSTAVREMLVSDALTFLDNLSSDAVGDPDLQRELALAYTKLGDVQGKLYSANTGNIAGAVSSYAKAISLLETAVSQRPSELPILSDLVIAYDSMLFALNRIAVSQDVKQTLLTRSAEILEEMLAKDPNDRSLQVKFAMLQVRTGDAQGSQGNDVGLQRKLEYHLKAVPIAEELERISDTDLPRLRTIARTYQRVGTDYMWLGEYALSQGEGEKAAAYFAQAHPFHEKMVRAAEHLAQIEPNVSDARRLRIAAYSSLAETLANNSRTDEALKHVEKALRLAAEARAADPSNREVDMELGTIRSIQGKIHALRGDLRNADVSYQAAVHAFELAGQRDPGNIEARSRATELYRRLEALHVEAGNDEKAAAYRQKIAN